MTGKTTKTIVAIALLTMVLFCVMATPVAARNYDRQVAADYAYNNAKNDVSGSWRFEFKGGDCTNFASHALQAGGWRQIGGSYTSDDAWFYGYPYRYGYSHTWSHANKFFRFLSRSNRVHPVSVVRHSDWLQIGDIVQIDYKDKNGNYGSWDHSMIVTGKNGNDPLMSYHSANREGRTRNKSLSTIRQENSNARFIGWSVHDNY